MAAVSLFWNTNMAAVTSLDNALLLIVVCDSDGLLCYSEDCFRLVCVRLWLNSPVGKYLQKYGVL